MWAEFGVVIKVKAVSLTLIAQASDIVVLVNYELSEYKIRNCTGKKLEAAKDDAKTLPRVTSGES